MGSEWEEMSRERSGKLGRSPVAASQLLSVLLWFALYRFVLPPETLTESVANLTEKFQEERFNSKDMDSTCRDFRRS